MSNLRHLPQAFRASHIEFAALADKIEHDTRPTFAESCEINFDAICRECAESVEAAESWLAKWSPDTQDNLGALCLHAMCKCYVEGVTSRMPRALFDLWVDHICPLINGVASHLAEE